MINNGKLLKEIYIKLVMKKKIFHMIMNNLCTKVYIQPFKIQKQFVSNKDYVNFIEDEGYSKPALWLSKGWEWINRKRYH